MVLGNQLHRPEGGESPEGKGRLTVSFRSVALPEAARGETKILFPIPASSCYKESLSINSHLCLYNS